MLFVSLHLVNQGWKQHVGRSPVSPKGMTLWNKVMRQMHLWAYSWMRPNYITNDQEYRISKFLFHKFIHSKAVLDAAEGNHDYINRIHMFFHQHIYVHEDLYLYYKRRLIRHLEVSHSSPHEVRRRLFHNKTCQLITHITYFLLFCFRERILV